jgi:hypothetical protein
MFSRASALCCDTIRSWRAKLSKWTRPEAPRRGLWKPPIWRRIYMSTKFRVGTLVKPDDDAQAEELIGRLHGFGDYTSTPIEMRPSSRRGDCALL